MMMMIESRSQICERNFNYETICDSDVFLPQICDIYFDRKIMMMLQSPSYQLLPTRIVPEVRHAIVSESAILQITSRNVQNIIVRLGLRSEYRSASDILPQV